MADPCFHSLLVPVVVVKLFLPPGIHKGKKKRFIQFRWKASLSVDRAPTLIIINDEHNALKNTILDNHF